MKKTNLIIGVALCLSSLILSSCASIQKDVVMSTDSFIMSEDVDDLQSQFAFYDSKILLEGKITAESPVYRELEKLEKDIEKTINASGANRILDSRLYALDGLCCLLQGKQQRAKILYAKSVELNKGDSYTTILGYRLGIIESLEDADVVSGSNQSVLLVLEQGLDNYSKGLYTDCVAKLDSAFIELQDFYRTAYNEVRQNAWSLKDNSSLTDNKSILSLLNKTQITAGEMCIITQETTELLNTMNAGKKYSEGDLLNRLKNAGFISSEVKRNSIVDRKNSARFLWCLYCSKRGMSDFTNESAVMLKEKAGYSPIPDVELDCSEFDAIIGVVEHEIMSLPDGVNFNPDKTVDASEFSSWLQKIR